MKHPVIFLCTILLSLNACAKSTAERWDAYFKRKLFDPPAGFVVDSLNFIPGNGDGKVAIDLGSGIGHETLVLLKKGFQVFAIDNQKNAFEYMKMQPDFAKYEAHLTPITSSFEKFNFSSIPSADLVVASFSLPFVAEQDFNQVWGNVVNHIKPGGYFIGNFFHPDFDFFDKKYHKHMTFHTKQEALHLFDQFNIIYFREVETPSLKAGTKEHYFIFFAKKKSN